MNRELTEEQCAAVTADPEADEINVVAGPGSGKTAVLAARAAYLIGCGVEPSKILCLTFTRSAAAEMRARVEAECGKVIDVATYHGFAARHVVLDGFRVATEIEAEAALQSLYKGPTRRNDVPCVSEMRQSLMRYEGGHEDVDRKPVEILAHRFRESKLVPMWALVRRWLDATEDGEDQRLDHILVDESQDATESESCMALRLSLCLFTVGDPRQSIMGWRGGGRWISKGVKYPLSRTFRFGPAIAEVANRVAAEFGGAPIVGADVESIVSEPNLDAVREALARGESVVVVCRTHRDCELARYELEMNDIDAEHIQRDLLDAFAMDADKIGDVIAARKIPVCTVHGFKGREADVVVVDDSVLAACDGRGTRAVTEEDHRVLYVAVTRAKWHLMMPRV